METRFYRFSRQSVMDGMARLAEMVQSQSKTLAIRGRDEAHEARISAALWQQAGFLAHSHKAPDGISRIHIGAGDFAADMIFVIDDAAIEERDCERLCLLFHAADGDIVNLRRADWKRMAKAGTHISYWAEKAAGGWEKAAEENAPA